MAGASITGVHGRIEWAYRVAATIHGYTVTRDGAHWSLRATLTTADAFALRQRPLLFVAPHAKGAWLWPITDCQRHDQTVTAQLGAPMETR